MDNASSEGLARGLLLPLVISFSCFVVYQLLQPRKWNPSEPPLIPSWIPYIGHPLNMLRHGGRYTRTLSKQFPSLPIFTLPAVTSRIYVVTSPTLAAEVQRKKTLLFDPLVPDLTQRVLGMDSATAEMMCGNVDRAEGSHGPVPEMHDAVAAGLGIGPVLEELTASSIAELVDELNSLGRSLGETSSALSLLKWTQHVYTVCTARFLYGPQNPIALDPSLESAFWDFDHGLGALLISIWPWNRKPLSGREKIAAAFKEYLSKGYQKQASTMVKKRMEVLQRNGFTLDGMARSELSFLFAGIVNTAVSSFWTVLRIFTDPELLKAIREEITDAHSAEEDSSDTSAETEESEDVLRLHLSTLKSSCPLLVATFREALRLSSDVASTRLATATTDLTHKTASGGVEVYTVLKDSIVQISGAAMHSNTALYGADAAVFNPHRFLDKHRRQSVHPAGFRAFGGGATLCPGRHLAAAEVLAWTAAVVMGFDLAGVRGARLLVPEKEDGRLPVHVCEPRADVRVEVGWRGRRVEVVTA